MLMITPYWEMVPEDSRFHYRFDGDSVLIRWIPPNRAQVELRFIAPNAVSQAYDYMIAQGAPSGSIRLGNIVSHITKTIGMQPCQSCRERQLEWNQIGRRR